MIEEDTCPTCSEHVCIFLQFEADVCNLRRWNARLEALTTNQERRRMVFSTYHRWRWGGGGGRTKLDVCVEIGVRSWFPDKAYMGFHDNENRKTRRQAIDMFGNRINLWWVYRDGAWMLDSQLVLFV